LASCVYKSLNKDRIIKHDVRLIGETDVKHQIDVSIETESGSKRVLIECKDFDISGDKVGLGIVRDFWGVVDDIHPDQSFVLTCNGFTRDARRYAKGKGIKLAVLREFRESDWEGRIRSLCVNITQKHISDPVINLYFDNQEQIDLFTKSLADNGLTPSHFDKEDPVWIVCESKPNQIIEYVQKVTNEYPRSMPGPVKLKQKLVDTTLTVGSKHEIPVSGVCLEFQVFHSKETYEFDSTSIALLILDDLEGTDIVIGDDDLSRMKIDADTGEVYI